MGFEPGLRLLADLGAEGSIGEGPLPRANLDDARIDSFESGAHLAVNVLEQCSRGRFLFRLREHFARGIRLDGSSGELTGGDALATAHLAKLLHALARHQVLLAQQIFGLLRHRTPPPESRTPDTIIRTPHIHNYIHKTVNGTNLAPFPLTRVTPRATAFTLVLRAGHRGSCACDLARWGRVLQFWDNRASEGAERPKASDMRKPLVAIVFMFAASNALADNSLYVGAGVTKTNASSACVNLLCFSENNTSWKAVAGYRPVTWGAVEADYVDLGRGTVRLSHGTPYLDASAAAAYAIGFLPLPLPAVEVFGKAGLARSKVTAHSYTFVPAGFPDPVSDNGLRFVWGMGLQLHSGRVGGRIEYERFSIPQLSGVHVFSLQDRKSTRLNSSHVAI